MDGSFACPECGSDVEVRGLAPGRQVRCGFCHRLLEVPYLPRAAGPSWKRRRFARPKWVHVGMGRARCDSGGGRGGRGRRIFAAAVRFDSRSVDQPVARVVAGTSPKGVWAKP